MVETNQKDELFGLSWFDVDAYIAYVYNIINIEMGYKKTMWSDKSAFSSEKELENLLLVNDDNKCEVRNLKYYNEIDIPTI